MREQFCPKTQQITAYTQVLLIQYMRYNSQIDKLDHKISCETSLKLNNVKYNLTGVVLHVGNTVSVGY